MHPWKKNEQPPRGGTSAAWQRGRRQAVVAHPEGWSAIGLGRWCLVQWSGEPPHAICCPVRVGPRTINAGQRKPLWCIRQTKGRFASCLQDQGSDEAPSNALHPFAQILGLTKVSTAAAGKPPPGEPWRHPKSFSGGAISRTGQNHKLGKVFTSHMQLQTMQEFQTQ